MTKSEMYRQMANGYVEMAEINLGIAQDAFLAEEGVRLVYEYEMGEKEA